MAFAGMAPTLPGTEQELGDIAMLSTIQKADILVRVGIAVPAMPPSALDSEHISPRWRQEVENLFTGYVADRAARSLRESEAARTLAHLRHANNRMTHPSHPDDHHDED